MPMSTRPRHRWSRGDDLVALYLTRHGNRALQMTNEAIANTLGMPEGSLVMRISNFRHLEGHEGLDHAAQQSRDVRARFGKLTEPEMRVLVVNVLQGKAFEG
jgi:hypothetical protein